MEHAIPEEQEPTTDRASDGLLTKREIATKLRVSARTVDQYMASGRLCFLKLGKTVRFSWPAVLAKLEAHRVN